MKRRALSTRHSAGFTLIEILVVIGIIALLIGIGVTAMNTSGVSVRVTTTKATIKALEDSVNGFVNERGSMPAITNAYQQNATNYVNSLALTSDGRKVLSTLRTNGAVTFTGTPTVGNVLGPFDAWQQNILMNGDATSCWFWSIGPKVGQNVPVNDSGGGNPVKGDDIGGTINTRK